MTRTAMAPPRPARQGIVSGVEHACGILGLFTRDAPEWGPAAAARTLGISKSHAHRLLRSLALLGLVERQASTRRYRLGMGSLALASVVIETSPLLANALPLLRSLGRETDLVAALAVWDRGGALWLQPDREPLLTHRELGECIAAGIVLLAGRPDTDVERADHAAYALVVGRGAGFRDELRGRLAHVRAGGMIGDFRAGNGGLCHLAAPIMDATHAVVAALSVQAPRARWQIHRNEFTCAVQSAAAHLTSMVARAGPDGLPRASVPHTGTTRALRVDAGA